MNKPNSEFVIRFIKTTLSLKELTPKSEMGSVRGWDSLSHLRLMNSIEKQFAVTIPTELFADLISVHQIINFLQSASVVEQ